MQIQPHYREHAVPVLGRQPVPFLPDLARLRKPRTAPFMAYGTCSSADFFHPEFHRLCGLMGVGVGYHRKLWEWVFIAHHVMKVVEIGTRGLGFGVGSEPMAGMFAREGVLVTATDAPHEIGLASGWDSGDQLASGLAAIPSLGMDRAQFERQVEFRECDMNAICPDLTDYDFCWSSCALEHLGDLQAGLDFIRNSVATLRPGGVAVHTTEYNLGSNDRTIAEGPCVLYRRRDLDALAAELEAEGHTVEPFVAAPDSSVIDGFVDMPPYVHTPHLKLLYDGFVTTSAGLVIHKAVKRQT